MKIFASLKKISGKNRRKTLTQYQHELRLRQGRAQFRRLAERGLHIPVALA